MKLAQATLTLNCRFETLLIRCSSFRSAEVSGSWPTSDRQVCPFPPRIHPLTGISSGGQSLSDLLALYASQTTDTTSSESSQSNVITACGATTKPDRNLSLLPSAWSPRHRHVFGIPNVMISIWGGHVSPPRFLLSDRAIHLPWARDPKTAAGQIQSRPQDATSPVRQFATTSPSSPVRRISRSSA